MITTFLWYAEMLPARFCCSSFRHVVVSNTAVLLEFIPNSTYGQVKLGACTIQPPYLLPLPLCISSSHFIPPFLSVSPCVYYSPLLYHVDVVSPSIVRPLDPPPSQCLPAHISFSFVSAFIIMPLKLCKQTHRTNTAKIGKLPTRRTTVALFLCRNYSWSSPTLHR